MATYLATRRFQARLSRSVRGAADKAAPLMRCKSSAVNGPMRTASLAGAWGGNDPRAARMSKPRLPYGVCRRGRSDRGGAHPYGPAHPGMTAASTRAPCGRRGTDLGARRPGPPEGKAAVVREATGPSPARAPGGGGHARRDRGAERTSGRSCAPQGLTATCAALGVRVAPRHAEGGGLAQEPVGARQVGACLRTGGLTSGRAGAHRARAQGRWARGSARSPRPWGAAAPWSARGRPPSRAGA